MEITKNINKDIFREYDIRGVYPTDLTENVSYTIGRGFASYIRDLGKNVCVVGHDNRLSSPLLYDSLIKGLTDSGVDVISLGLCTTPMYYYACIYKKIYQGLMVTASHNPKEYNGYKIAFSEEGNAKGKEITDFYDYLMKGDFKEGHGLVTEYNVHDDYIDLFDKSLSFGSRTPRVLIDPGNGTTSIIVHDLFDRYLDGVQYIFDESDGTFPNHHPDPAVEENLSILKKKVVEGNFDCGISFDGDGDRVGLVSNSGKYIPADLIMLIVIRNIINKVSKKEFLYDVKCTKALSDEIEKLGGKGVMYRTGNSYTKAAVRDMDLPYGGELSGHMYFRDKFPGFDSGIYAGLRICEILSHTDKSIDELLEGINKYYSTPEIKIATTDDAKFKIVEKVREYADSRNYKYVTMDGVKIMFDDSWALVRASNTGPNLTLRFEARSEERLEELKSEFLGVVNINLDIK